MIFDTVVPRLPNGGVALCHLHQRSVFFAGGFMRYLIELTQRAASQAFVDAARATPAERFSSTVVSSESK